MKSDKCDKWKITEILVNQLPADYFETQNIEDIIFKIWLTGRTGSGLGLTTQGYNAFTKANFNYYDYSINDLFKKHAKNFVKLPWILDKKIKCPYYIIFEISVTEKRNAYIRIYDSTIAMMINLYGSFAEYLELAKT